MLRPSFTFQTDVFRVSVSVLLSHLHSPTEISPTSRNPLQRGASERTRDTVRHLVCWRYHLETSWAASNRHFLTSPPPKQEKVRGAVWFCEFLEEPPTPVPGEKLKEPKRASKRSSKREEAQRINRPELIIQTSGETAGTQTHTGFPQRGHRGLLFSIPCVGQSRGPKCFLFLFSSG